jgi:hypothetical protein
VAQEDVRRLRTEADPVARAREATKLLGEYQAAVTELSRIRREAFDDLRRQGYSQTDVARMVGLSRGRIGQLNAAGPLPERAFFGDNDLTAIVAQKQEGGRGRPVVAAETLAALSRLQALAATMSLGVRVESISPPGTVDLNRDNLMVLGGPRVLPIVGTLMEADPYLRFLQRPDGRWYLRDLHAEQDFESPQDAGENRDYGYLGRLQRPDGNGSLLIAAGIHPIGLQGAIALLETDLPELYETVRGANFSLMVECTYDPTTLSVTKASRVTPVYQHPSEGEEGR